MDLRHLKEISVKEMTMSLEDFSCRVARPIVLYNVIEIFLFLEWFISLRKYRFLYCVV